MEIDILLVSPLSPHIPPISFFLFLILPGEHDGNDRLALVARTAY